MRKSYHIHIKEEDRASLDTALKTLGITPSITIIMRQTITEWDYIVGLSKYELLYVRLAVKGDIVYIPSQEQQQQGTKKKVLQQS